VHAQRGGDRDPRVPAGRVRQHEPQVAQRCPLYGCPCSRENAAVAQNCGTRLIRVAQRDLPAPGPHTTEGERARGSTTHVHASPGPLVLQLKQDMYSVGIKSLLCAAPSWNATVNKLRGASCVPCCAESLEACADHRHRAGAVENTRWRPFRALRGGCLVPAAQMSRANAWVSIRVQCQANGQPGRADCGAYVQAEAARAGALRER
jgi:hypothetical protein